MTDLNASTLHLTDEELMSKVEGRTLDVAFHHADHIRLAWVYLRMMPSAEAEERMAATLRRYSAHKGKPERYHHTMTLAWMRLVAAAQRATPKLIEFEEFIAAHPDLVNQQTVLQYFSQQQLDHPTSRTEWLEPDIQPLP
jgi:hypothetical protein